MLIEPEKTLLLGFLLLLLQLQRPADNWNKLECAEVVQHPYDTTDLGVNLL